MSGPKTLHDSESVVEAGKRVETGITNRQVELPALQNEVRTNQGLVDPAPGALASITLSQGHLRRGGGRRSKCPRQNMRKPEHCDSHALRKARATRHIPKAPVTQTEIDNAQHASGLVEADEKIANDRLGCACREAKPSPERETRQREATTERKHNWLKAERSRTLHLERQDEGMF